MLDSELELDDYIVNFRRMFGDQWMEAVLDSPRPAQSLKGSTDITA